MYIRSGSLDHMSVAIKMVKGKPVLITYKDEMMLVREKMEAMKLRKKVLDDFKARAHARAQKNNAKAKAARMDKLKYNKRTQHINKPIVASHTVWE